MLERKNRHRRLNDAILFATLEPCAPGSRRHPKLSCAERITLARIKEVWVGIQDPDPTVDRKGIKYLQDSGVTVHMFDRDLQEEILAANDTFIEQALERAAVARRAKKPKAITLSPLESAVAAADTRDLSSEALEQYREVAKISDRIESAGFKPVRRDRKAHSSQMTSSNPQKSGGSPEFKRQNYPQKHPPYVHICAFVF